MLSNDSSKTASWREVLDLHGFNSKLVMPYRAKDDGKFVWVFGQVAFKYYLKYGTPNIENPGEFMSCISIDDDDSSKNEFSNLMEKVKNMHAKRVEDWKNNVPYAKMDYVNLYDYEKE